MRRERGRGGEGGDSVEQLSKWQTYLAISSSRRCSVENRSTRVLRDSSERKKSSRPLFSSWSPGCVDQGALVSYRPANGVIKFLQFKFPTFADPLSLSTERYSRSGRVSTNRWESLVTIVSSGVGIRAVFQPDVLIFYENFAPMVEARLLKFPGNFGRNGNAYFCRRLKHVPAAILRDLLRSSKHGKSLASLPPLPPSLPPSAFFP